MLIFTKAQALRQYLETLDHTIGFVPTMGALHQGHISLVNIAKKQSQLCIASIFVNPTQFNNAEDLAKYPRTTATDIEQLEAANCDILYLPEVTDIYPDGTTLQSAYELGFPATVLEGNFRPGHFQGVAQVVDRLLAIIKPDAIILGQKDLQQIAIIKAMASTHHPSVEIITAPTLRDDDGLAKSSRNQRLNIAQRATAPVIYQTLISIQAKQNLATFEVLKKESIMLLEQKGFQVDYISLINRDTWETLEQFDPTVPMAILIAAFLGNVRLIDNILL